MPTQCPQCQERNPSNADQCIHCGHDLPSAQSDGSGSSAEMISLVVVVVLAILGFVFKDQIKEVLANSQSIDVVCAYRMSKEASELKSLGYKRCESAFRRDSCRNKNRPLCFEKPLKDGESKYRPGVIETVKQFNDK